MSLNLGQAGTKLKTTGRLFFQRITSGTAESNWLDMGNVNLGGLKPTVERAKHMASDNGFKRTDYSAIKTIDPTIEVELTEHTPDLERLRALSSAGQDTTVSGGTVSTGSPETLTASSLKGRTYFAAKEAITRGTLVVKVSSTTYTEDTDYKVDYGSGAITILNGSGIADASTVTISYSYGTVTRRSFTNFSELRTEGNFKFIEKDQNSTTPRKVTTWQGELFVSDWGEIGGDDFTKTKVTSIPLTDPVTKVRVD